MTARMRRPLDRTGPHRRRYPHLRPQAAAPASITAEAVALKTRMLARAHHDYDLLRSALGASVPAAAAPTHDALVKEIEAHAWVQAQVNGQWIDLDPSFPDSTVGHAYAS